MMLPASVLHAIECGELKILCDRQLQQRHLQQSETHTLPDQLNCNSLSCGTIELYPPSPFGLFLGRIESNLKYSKREGITFSADGPPQACGPSSGGWEII
jgi:hypothetical protein